MVGLGELLGSRQLRCLAADSWLDVGLLEGKCTFSKLQRGSKYLHRLCSFVKACACHTLGRQAIGIQTYPCLQ